MKGQPQMRETMCCRGLSTGVQAQNRGGKGLETSCVEVILSITAGMQEILGVSLEIVL